jgi:hypothetical protein
VRYASLLFALLATLVIISNASLWIRGAPLRLDAFEVALLATYCAISILLWRQVRLAAFVGLAVSAIVLLLLLKAILFIWPFVSIVRPETRDVVGFIVAIAAPTAVNLLIVAVLGRVLLSNNRWRVP